MKSNKRRTARPQNYLTEPYRKLGITKDEYRVVMDHAISISNKINRIRVEKCTKLPFIDEYRALKMIIEFQKENNLDIMTASKRLTMQVSQNTYKGDCYEQIR